MRLKSLKSCPASADFVGSWPTAEGGTRLSRWRHQTDRIHERLNVTPRKFRGREDARRDPPPHPATTQSSKLAYLRHAWRPGHAQSVTHALSGGARSRPGWAISQNSQTFGTKPRFEHLRKPLDIDYLEDFD